MFKKLSDSLRDKYFKKNEVSRQLEIARVLVMYKKELDKLFPGTNETRPVSLNRKKQLIVQVQSPAMASELRLRESQIIEKINKAFGGQMIERIIYRF